MSLKCLITSRSFGNINDEPYAVLRNAGYEYLKIGADFSQEEFEKIVPDYDAAIIGVHPFPSDVLAKCHKLRIIAKNGVGLDNIPLEQCKKQGIAVTNTPGTNSNAVADLTFALMLNVARNVKLTNMNIAKGNVKPVMGNDVCFKTLGLLGFGAIAKCVARRASGFGMKILAYDPFIKELPEEFRTYVKLCSFSEVTENCDYLSVHMPLTDETKNMISATQLAKMKKGTVIINTARGGIVNEKDLYDAIISGHIYGAGIDCVENEPPSADNPLYSLDTVIITPHIGMYSKEAINAVGLMCAKNCAAIVTGEELVNQVC
ncbi:MAG: phosphoglycerate dehydrogenase [Sphaerochaetaceae bacterium]|nr:phosphoglycerate dehydrogenase [Sphaerochaetaceae bacterium]